MSLTRPLTLTVAALGGQGGGVLTEWLVAAARLAGFHAQATSVPGVAQRTGATIYYLEFFPDAGDGRQPVMALMPAAGDVDIVLAAELVEAGRMVERGFVTPDRTTLVASTHRAYTVDEKAEPGDGRLDPVPLQADLAKAARRLVAFDMAALAARERAVVSPVLFGALQGCGALPFPVDACREAIKRYGLAVEVNLRAFDAAVVAAREGVAPDVPAAVAIPSVPAALLHRVERYAAPVRTLVAHGIERCREYQDDAYALTYLERLDAVAAADPAGSVTAVMARTLPLWMCFEDPIRVAQLKLAPGRIAGIRHHALAKPTDLVHVREFLRPRVEEIAGLLPNAWGRRVLRNARLRQWLRRFERDVTLTSTSVTGYLLLRGLMSLRRFRRGSLRFAEETRWLSQWHAAVVSAAVQEADLGVELAECQSLVRGYGETIERGHARLQKVLTLSSRAACYTAANVRLLREAAERDGDGDAFEQALARVVAGGPKSGAAKL
jgi:indolepyruvate ferredoxin oxidoreductase beta subunit